MPLPPSETLTLSRIWLRACVQIWGSSDQIHEHPLHPSKTRIPQEPTYSAQRYQEYDVLEDQLKRTSSLMRPSPQGGKVTLTTKMSRGKLNMKNGLSR